MSYELEPEDLASEAERARELWERVYKQQIPVPAHTRVRFPRVTRDRFGEAEFGQPYVVFTKGLRSNALDDDKITWLQFQQRIADFDNDIKDLREKCGNKLVIKIRHLQPFGRPRLTIKTPAGKKLKERISGEELRELGARSAAMPLRRAREIEAELKKLERQILKALEKAPKLLDELLDVAFRRARVGGGPLGLTDTIANQIKQLAVSDASYEASGHWCPLPANCFEHLRTVTSITMIAINCHLLTMNSMYNLTNLKAGRRFRKRGAMYLRALNTGPMLLPKPEWLRSMLTGAFQRPLLYTVVTRSIYSKSVGRKTLEKTVQVQTPQGTLNPQAVAYAGLPQMWDIYRWVDQRASEIKAINIKQLSLFRPILVGRDHATSQVKTWADSCRAVEPKDLAILTR